VSSIYTTCKLLTETVIDKHILVLFLSVILRIWIFLQNQGTTFIRKHAYEYARTVLLFIVIMLFLIKSVQG
jgi:hypothetical protein